MKEADGGVHLLAMGQDQDLGLMEQVDENAAVFTLSLCRPRTTNPGLAELGVARKHNNKQPHTELASGWDHGDSVPLMAFSEARRQHSAGNGQATMGGRDGYVG